MKRGLVLEIARYIDKYRVVSLSNIMSRFPQFLKNDILIATSTLYRRSYIRYSCPSDKNPSYTYYFSNTYNPYKSLTANGNSVTAITKCLTVLDSFREHYNISHEKLDFFPVVIRFDVELDNKTSRVQLIYLEYSEQNKNAEYISTLISANEDLALDINRYIVVESYGMLNKACSQEICDYIPRVRGFALCSNNYLSAEFFSLESLGVNNDI